MKERMEKTIETLKSHLSQVRAGRAASSMVENLTVEVYGSKMPLNQLATISVPDSSTILIQPWDVSNVAEINKAFLASNLNLTPVVESNQLRVTIPALTSERREQLVKVIKTYGEDAKIGIRVNRKDAMDAIDQQLKEKEITETEEKIEKKKVEDMTKEYNAIVEQLAQTKINEILSI